MFMPDDEDSVKTKCEKWLEKCETDSSSSISSNYASASSASHSRSIQEETEFFSCDKNVFHSDFFDSLEEVKLYNIFFVAIRLILFTIGN